MLFNVLASAVVLFSASLVAAHGGDYYKGKEILVQVGLNATGGAALRYNPSEVYAEVGDTILFQFFPKNHSVVLSSFETPCIGQKDDDGKFIADSGFFPIPPLQVGDDSTFFSVEVEDKEASVWYCRQTVGAHCGNGMVLVVNPKGDVNIKTVTQRAIEQNGTVTATTTAAPAEPTETWDTSEKRYVHRKEKGGRRGSDGRRVRL